ncbi:MAG TPA: DNA polymerase III subunit alpha [Syntrophomonadaceae bacterium]|nr:DNA polymerase III subunit alpha [Syntrophomonadaceae bacterium]
MSFIHLHCHSPFSFLDGASEIKDLVRQTAEMGMSALALTDHDNLCAAVQFNRAAREAGIKPIQGAEITLEGGYHMILLAQGPKGYASLCGLISSAQLNSPRGKPEVSFQQLEGLENVIIISGCRRSPVTARLMMHDYSGAVKNAMVCRSLAGPGSFYLELQNPLQPGGYYLNHRLAELGKELNIPLVATNDVHYSCKKDFILHDLLCCVRNLITVEAIHSERPINGESYLKSPAEMKNLFIHYPQAIENTVSIAGQCHPVLSEQSLHFPSFQLPPGEAAPVRLRELCWEGAHQRYHKINLSVTARLEHELQIIEQMGFADYFLVVWDLARFCRQEGIRYAGRGSAADSLVAYCLYITEVDSLKRGLLFERFMNPERVGMPDIDVDFESRYRDKVVDYVYKKYGSDHVARVATYNTFRARSALRDLGKALGFPETELGPLCKRLPFYAHADQIRALLKCLPELRDSPLQDSRYGLLLDCCEKLAGFPRFLGMHLGGMVISDIPIIQLTPLQKSALGPVISQFDKDDIEELGLIKLDLLSLRTLSVVQDVTAQLQREGNPVDYDNIPLNDQPTYDMINQGETIGVFQLESPAQRSLQTRLEASQFEDIVASMALIRPGPIKGNMVDPYVNRRLGKEKVSYLHPWLEPILKNTYGVVLFQEQVIEIAQVMAGFTPGEADQLRRVMTHTRSQRAMDELGDKFIERSVQRGIERSLAQDIFNCMMGYASYGFCEAHAAAFATTSYKTAYLVKHYPAQYYAAILNNQPMGFYPARVIVNEARRHKIKILPPDANRSEDIFTVENGAIRVGLKQIKGMSRRASDNILQARTEHIFTSPQDFILRTAISYDLLENLIKCGALDCLHDNRRYMLTELPEWAERRENKNSGMTALFTADGSYRVKDVSKAQRRRWEYEILELEVESHRMSEWRQELTQKGILSSRDLTLLSHHTHIKTAGILLHPHRPPTRSGRITVFFSLEDEFGMIDVTMFENTYLQFGKCIFGPQSGPLVVEGYLQRRGQGIAVIAEQVYKFNEN